MIKEKNAIRKIEEQIEKSHTINYNPASILLWIFQKEPVKLREEEKFDDKTNFKLYPSDMITQDYTESLTHFSPVSHFYTP